MSKDRPGGVFSETLKELLKSDEFRQTFGDGADTLLRDAEQIQSPEEFVREEVIKLNRFVDLQQLGLADWKNPRGVPWAAETWNRLIENQMPPRLTNQQMDNFYKELELTTLSWESPSERIPADMRPGPHGAVHPEGSVALHNAQERYFANQQSTLPAGSIAAHNAQEREYAYSQGSRPSVNPNDTYTSVLDDVANSGRPGWGTGGSGSSGSGSGHRDEGSRPGPGQTLSGGSGRGDGGTGSGSSSGGSSSSVTGGRGTPSPTTGGSTPSTTSRTNPSGVDNDYGRNDPPSRPSTPSTPSTRNDPDDPGRIGPQPVVLDLDSNGFDISTLDTSNTFVAMDESGLLTRTAWARGNDGVLVIDANNDGKISSSKEFVFTEWANGARTDFEALKQVFDTNHNGKLDAGDARFGEFRVSVGGQLVSLASLGITSIDLTATGSGQVFADGSAITGTSTFVRNGVTYQAGDANSKTGITRIVAEANFAPALLH